MRLTAEEVQVIKQAIYEQDSQAQVYLFGSRANPQKRGGDIDLLLISKQGLEMQQIIAIKLAIEDQLGAQKIDILMAKSLDDPRPIVQIALNEGVQL